MPSLLRRGAVALCAAATLTPLTLPAPATAADTTAPTASWVTPTEGQVVKGVLSWSGCRVNASDAGGIAAVEFWVRGVRVTRQSGAPFECSWDSRTVADGDQILEARAIDRSGNVRTVRRTVRVANSTSAPAPAPAPAPIPVPTSSDPAPEPTPTTGCASFPSRLRTIQPSDKGGDVSHAFVDTAGCKVTLNGFNSFPVWSSDHYRGIKAKGFNALRFILPWRDYEPKAGTFAKLGDLDWAISQARAAGLYVVLDTHIDNWNTPPAWATGTDDVDKVQRHAKRFTQMLATRYADEPAVAALDLVNEPPSHDQARILRLYDAMIGWVREVEADKIVITMPGHGNSDMTKADESLQRYHRNVVYSIHDYYAGNGNASTTSIGYNQYGGLAGNWTWNGTTGYKTTGDAPDLAANLNVHVGWARRADLPMWVGEWAINPSATNATAWVDAKIALYKKFGLGRAWWLYTCQDGLAIRTSSASGCAWKPIVSRLL